MKHLCQPLSVSGLESLRLVQTLRASTSVVSVALILKTLKAEMINTCNTGPYVYCESVLVTCISDV